MGDLPIELARLASGLSHVISPYGGGLRTTLQPYSGRDCLCLPTVGRSPEVKIASGLQQARAARPPVRHVDVMQAWHRANLEHAFNLVGAEQVDTMQSDNQSNHRRGKTASTQQARLTVRSLGSRGELRGEGAAIMVGGGHRSLVCQGRSGCEGGMGCSSHVAKTLTRLSRAVVVIALVAWQRFSGVCRSPRHVKLGLMLEGSIAPCPLAGMPSRLRPKV